MRQELSQETLKLIACVSMLLDHIGAVFFPWVGLRVIGRLAFPIYCFLLAEGAFHTRSPMRYALRLIFGMLLSELPYDLLFYGGATWQHQSVMVTLLLAFSMMCVQRRIRPLWGQVSAMLPFALLADVLGSDYGFWGVILAGMFFITREMPSPIVLQTMLLGLICLCLPSSTVTGIPIQLFAIAAMLPIALYSGRKQSTRRALQWGFYLFYPMHLAVLYGLSLLIFQ